ncbi:MAG: hypothetical protein ACO3QV_02255 [Candidatus Nanopelagicaceae bacterium]
MNSEPHTYRKGTMSNQEMEAYRRWYEQWRWDYWGQRAKAVRRKDRNRNQKGNG